ncbi:MAG: hypothetical protein H9802_02665 [Candidatus Phocaeicola faecipullorum]|nr:hypothetical protein [Candidatus Phocaeicola faecipullorum]
MQILSCRFWRDGKILAGGLREGCLLRPERTADGIILAEGLGKGENFPAVLQGPYIGRQAILK